jgi:plastocyanin
MKKHSAAYVLVTMFLLLSLILLASCGGGGGGGSTPPTATSTVLSTACSGTISAVVNAVGFSSFISSAVSISVNQIVRWNNATGVTHTVTSTTVPANGTFDVGLGNGTSICLMFTAPGTFNYKCSIHPVMTGSITVN